MTGLTLLACWPAFALSLPGLLPLLHGIFLISSYSLIRLLAGRLNKWVGKLAFAGATLLLLADILVQQVTGLHLNLFVVSVMLQPGISAELGVSGVTLFSTVLAFVALSLFTAKLLREPSFMLHARKLMVVGAVAAVLSQILYATLYFNGVAEIEEIRRKLPFFTAPHPYYREKVLSKFLTKNTDNPFAITAAADDKITASHKPLTFSQPQKNLLMIIVDSLRAKDITANPELAPNLREWAKKGSFSLDHYSTSNCTQFSFYSMFTGKLPVGFGAARRGNRSTGLLTGMAEGGYNISTAEANSLDWYDTASILLPAISKRYISEADGTTARDKDVTLKTIKLLTEAQETGEPFFHLAYYFGPHYPYDPTVEAIPGSNLKKYKHTIRAFDQELALLLAHVEKLGLLKNTLVIVTADHGEEFQETGRTGHATRLTDEQVKVPFLLIDHTYSAPKKQLFIQSHLDIAPYLLSQVSLGNKYTPQDIVLANCGYDYPSGFALFLPAGRADFFYRDGYLTPMPAPDGQAAPKALLRDAARVLLPMIKSANGSAPSE